MTHIKEYMEKFFYPKSICVVGVSDIPGNLGFFILENLNTFGFKGRWYAVGHIPGVVFEQPIYQSVLDIPEKTDLAVILTRPEYVPETVEAIGEKGIKHVIISSAGFSECHAEGYVLEQKILTAAERYGLRIIGCGSRIFKTNKKTLPTDYLLHSGMIQ